MLLLVYTFLVNMSLSIGAQYVNKAVGAEPYLYKHSIVFSAIMSVPVVAALVLAIIWLSVVIFGFLYLLFGLNIKQVSDSGFLSDVLPKHIEKHFAFTTVVRIIAIGTISYSSYSLFNGYNERYNDFVVIQTQAFLYHFEALEESRCEVKTGTKFLPLNENEIIIVTKLAQGKYNFELEECKPKLVRT
ncbi:hypothetical protein ACB087_15350 [Vibrio sp. VNB-15]